MKRLAILLILPWHLGCQTNEKIDAATAEGGFKRAKNFEKSERYEEAIAHYNEVKNKHPYSRYAVESKLAVADIEYKRENFVEAEAAYKLFKEFHPSHAKVDYVTFRLGMSYFKQLPSTIDRDLSLAQDAIQYFNEVINSFPGSDYVGASKDHRKKALKMLAGKEKYVADFYLKQKMYDSALGRYETILKEYPNLGFDLSALYGATVSAFRSRDLGRAKIFYDQLTREGRGSSEAHLAKKEVGNELK